MNITQYSDPGHSWYKVPVKLLTALGIQKDISGWSFIKEDFAYLEEDCDASLLFFKMESRDMQYTVKTKHTNRRSKIRGYERYNSKIM